MFPYHGKAHPGPLRYVKEILKNRYLSGRRTSAKDMYKDNVISEADMCDAAKRLVGKGLPARVDTSLESQFSAEALEANKVKFEKKAKVAKDSSEEEDSDYSDEDLSVAELRAKMKGRKSAAAAAAAAAEVRCTVSVGGVKRAMLHSVFHSNRPSSSK